MHNRYKYPVPPYQIMCGKVPSMWEMGPPDTRPTSSTAPRFQGKLHSMYGRNLAGLGSVQVADAKAEPAYTFNELQYYAEMDDIQGSGIFDPPGSIPNIHPDAGVFATRYSLPGYDARERPFGFSEVRDVTTGRPVRVVPAGAVATDSAAQIAFLEKGLYDAPQPVVDAANERPEGFVSTVNVMQNPIPVSGLGELSPTAKNALLIISLGLATGVAIRLFQSRKGGRK